MDEFLSPDKSVSDKVGFRNISNGNIGYVQVFVMLKVGNKNS